MMAGLGRHGLNRTCVFQTQETRHVVSQKGRLSESCRIQEATRGMSSALQYHRVTASGGSNPLLDLFAALTLEFVSGGRYHWLPCAGPQSCLSF